MHMLHGGHPAETGTRGRTIHWAKYYDPLVKLLLFGRYNRFRQATIALARIAPGERVLDVGCGTGDLTLLAGQRAGASGEVYGIDAAPEMIEVARQKAAHRKAPVKFQVDRIEALSFPDASFDVVISSLMFHHLPDDLKGQALAEIRRVLKPGGRLMIVDFRRPESSLGRMMITAAMHSGLESGVQNLEALLSEAGFTHLEAENTPIRLVGCVRARK